MNTTTVNNGAVARMDWLPIAAMLRQAMAKEAVRTKVKPYRAISHANPNVPIVPPTWSAVVTRTAAEVDTPPAG